MKEAKKDRVPLFTMLCLAVILLIQVAAFEAASVLGSHLESYRTVVITIMGLIMFAFCQFFREKEYYRAAPYLYAICVALLGFQLITGDPYYPYDMRVLKFDYYYIYSSAFLSLTYLFVAWYIGRQKQFTFREFLILSLMMGVPALLITLQGFPSFGAVALIVYTVTMCYLKKEKRLKVYSVFIFLPVVLTLILAIIFFASTEYGRNLFQLFITRGRSDVFGEGWERLVADRILEESRAFGYTRFSGFYELITDWDYYWSGSNLAMILAILGYVPVLALLGFFTLLFILIFRMTSRINQSRFAKSVALMLSVYLLAKALISVFGLLFLTRAPFDLPFMGRNTSFMITDYIALSFIISLYRRRDDKSATAEIEAKRTDDEHVSVVSVVRDYVNDDEQDIDGYFCHKDKPLERIKRILLGEEEDFLSEEEFYREIEEMFEKQKKEATKADCNKSIPDEDETYIQDSDFITTDPEEEN